LHFALITTLVRLLEVARNICTHRGLLPAPRYDILYVKPETRAVGWPTVPLGSLNALLLYTGGVQQGSHDRRGTE
jgi:hypothetical protein